jgi:magnesium transporter
LVEKLEDAIEKLQDQVIGWAGTVVLERIAETRNSLMEFRRLLSGTRHAVFRLRHMPSPLVSQELSPFLRDVQDDLTIVLETTAVARDRLAGILDIYLSSVAHRTTEATRTLTLMGTIALPAIVITGFFGMAIDYPAWTKGPWMFPFLGVLTAAVTIFLVLYLKRRDYLPGGSTAKGLLKGPGPKPRELQ